MSAPQPEQHDFTPPSPTQEIGQQPAAQESKTVDAMVEELMRPARYALALDGSNPQREEKFLELMDGMEATRTEAGNFCETIGEGRDRAIAVRIPVTTSLEEPALLMEHVPG